MAETVPTTPNYHGALRPQQQHGLRGDFLRVVGADRKPVSGEAAETPQFGEGDANDRIAEGATSIYRGGLVLGIVTGTEGTKLKVAIGDYNEMIDKRIAEIEKTCGL